MTITTALALFVLLLLAIAIGPIGLLIIILVGLFWAATSLQKWANKDVSNDK